MKVMREIKTDHFEVGDRIRADLPGEMHTATAIQDEGDGMLFVFDQCLEEAMPMNRNGSTKGGYDASDMRNFLQELSEKFPEELKERMIPFENGDTVRLLTLPEVCGKDGHWNRCEGQIPYFKDSRNRIAGRKGDSYEWMWTATVVLDAYFAFVGGDDGTALYYHASVSFGVRPVFKLRTPGSRSTRTDARK